ncbi:13467_t:CDS:2, partial [Gigaspora margarita]
NNVFADGSQQKIISQKGLICLAQEEGFCSKCYQDIYCHWTIGYGFYIGDGNNRKLQCKKSEPMNKDNALVRLNNTANTESVGYVRRFVKKPLNNDQFDALVIFAYNYLVGVKCVADYINTKGFSGVRDAWLKCNKDNNGLENRRKFEVDLFESKIKSCNIPKENCPKECPNAKPSEEQTQERRECAKHQTGKEQTQERRECPMHQAGEEQTQETLKNKKQQRKLFTTTVKVQITILVEKQTQERKKSPKHQTWQRTNTKKSKVPNLVKHKKVQSTKPSEEQAQKNPKHQTQQKTSTRMSKAPNPAKNKYKKVQSTKPSEVQTQESPKCQICKEQTQEKKVQITIPEKFKYKKGKKVQNVNPGKVQVQERKESPNHQSWRDTKPKESRKQFCMAKFKTIQFKYFDSESIIKYKCKPCKKRCNKVKNEVMINDALQDDLQKLNTEYAALQEKINLKTGTLREKLDSQEIALENEKDYLKKVADSLGQECRLLSLEILFLKSENSFLQSLQSQISP